jgi:hypothetical protein
MAEKVLESQLTLRVGLVCRGGEETVCPAAGISAKNTVQERHNTVPHVFLYLEDRNGARPFHYM